MKLQAYAITVNVWGESNLSKKEIDSKLKEIFSSHISKKKVVSFIPSYKTSSGRSVFRDFLRQRDGDLCYWCKEPLDFSLKTDNVMGVTIEHIKRRCEGGTDDLENLALAHNHCNSTRHNKK